MICVRCSLPAVAANNGTPQQIQQQTQQCISQFNSSAFGKFVNFFSMASPFIGPDRLGSAVEDVGGSAAKYAAFRTLQFLQNAPELIQGPEWAQWSSVVAGVGAQGLEAVAKDVVLPVAAGSTGLQILAHAGCNTVARQNAGQMNPLPAGIISGNP
jgi:hypothetical protein